jgi:CHRD domain
MKISDMLRTTIPAIAILAALMLTGCQTLSSALSKSNVTLSGDEEVPPVNTKASGSGTITVKDDMTVGGSVKTSNVVGTMAHIHMAPAGRNGPVIITLVKSKDGNTWSVPEGAKLTEAQFNAYRAGGLYVNVHSAANKGGEVRGQLRP